MDYGLEYSMALNTITIDHWLYSGCCIYDAIGWLSC